MRLLALFCTAAALLPAQVTREKLVRKILDPNQPLLEVQVYTAARMPALPTFTTAAEWDKYAATLRQRMLDEVVFRGEAKSWRDAKTKAEVLAPFATGPGYRVRHFRYEIIPDLWMGGVIYEPQPLTGRVPVVLNVNGHEGVGTATSYIQARCINLAKKGLIAVNPDWLGKGQADVPGQNHYRMNQIDLTGSSGLALFYLGLKRALDIAESLPNADPKRLAVTGLSGGGWQTIYLSALDTRVAVSQPVAGYSSFVTRAQWPDLDLGDSEQTPTDMASVGDYTHMTALLAPRTATLAYNAKDNCCFRAEYAVSPLMVAGLPAYRLHDAESRLRYHINHGAGHNYDEDNREALYRTLKSAFGVPADTKDIPVTGELRPIDALRPELPADNLDFHKLARKLAESLPKPGNRTREDLARIVRYPKFAVDATEVADGLWKLRMDSAWTVPAVEIAAAAAKGTTIVLADDGREAAADEIDALVRAGARALAVDPFYFGESRIARRDYLFAMQVASLGERPLGIQAGQVAAAARWLTTSGKGPVKVLAKGPRTSLIAQIAAALEPAITAVDARQAMASLKEILEQDLRADQRPEQFCFGLLEAFDIPQIKALAAAR